MEIIKIEKNKYDFLDLLLIGDEQEEMIAKYIVISDLFVLFERKTAQALYAALPLGDGVCEIKNLAVYEPFRKRGLGRVLLSHAASYYGDTCQWLLVGTGESPATLLFYEKCGFVFSHRIPNFFTQYYDHPIIEGGVLLRDMIYLKRPI